MIYASTIPWDNEYEQQEPGYIYAINSDGSMKWVYETNTAQKNSLVLGVNNTLYTLDASQLIGLSD